MNKTHAWLRRYWWTIHVAVVVAAAGIIAASSSGDSGSSAGPATTATSQTAAAQDEWLVVAEVKMSVLHPDHNQVIGELQGTLIAVRDDGKISARVPSGETIEGSILEGRTVAYETVAGSGDMDGVLVAELPVQVNAVRDRIQPTRVRVISKDDKSSSMIVTVEFTDKEGKSVKGRITDVDRDSLKDGQLSHRKG